MDKIKTTGMIQYVIDNEPGVIRYIVAVNLNELRRNLYIIRRNLRNYLMVRWLM